MEPSENIGSNVVVPEHCGSHVQRGRCWGVLQKSWFRVVDSLVSGENFRMKCTSSWKICSSHHPVGIVLWTSKLGLFKIDEISSRQVLALLLAQWAGADAQCCDWKPYHYNFFLSCCGCKWWYEVNYWRPFERPFDHMKTIWRPFEGHLLYCEIQIL